MKLSLLQLNFPFSWYILQIFRYPNIAIEEIREVCPACRGICNCRKCLHGENLIKVSPFLGFTFSVNFSIFDFSSLYEFCQARIQEISSMEKLRHLHRVLSFLFPVLKRIHSEQCYELDLEIRVNGVKILFVTSSLFIIIILLTNFNLIKQALRATFQGQSYSQTSRCAGSCLKLWAFEIALYWLLLI